MSSSDLKLGNRLNSASAFHVLFHPLNGSTRSYAERDRERQGASKERFFFFKAKKDLCFS